ncbi:hypothetical protein [Pyxidicoccus sp. MSG2]|uniref:hypothetical protein n=1 Tax=Pyxidicoccus sp. MSG2 TaxID=2996790 RepID=UPI00226F24F1|nr:hypothetical protein [Pyxidicoccus sp. MSG2]MCY1019595.1 hypothetical protein [Pyxidicoccus sp. MSG2]
MAGARGKPDWQTRLRASNQRRLGHGVLLLIWCAIGVAGAKVMMDVLVAVLQVLVDPVPMGSRHSMTNVPAVGLVLGGLLLAAGLTGWLWVGFRFAWFLLRSVLGEDQLAMDSKGVTWRRWLPPWSKVHSLPYSDVAAFPERVGDVMALLHTGRTVVLATLGTVSELEELRKQLRGRSELGSTPAVLSDCIPKDREAVPVPGGGVALRRRRDDPGNRAWVLGGVALLLGVSAAVVMWRQDIDGASVEGPLLALALSGLAGWVGLKAWPSFQSRWEWQVRPGVLDRVRYRIGRPERVSHRAKSLEVRRNESEDSEESFSLWMHTSKGPVMLEKGWLHPELIDHLGQWLAHRLEVRLDRRDILDSLPRRKSSRRRRTG